MTGHTQITVVDVAYLRAKPDRPDEKVQDEKVQRSLAYRVKLGRERIWLSCIEYRILMFLASKPYHAFTPRRIVDAVNTDQYPLKEETLAGHIASLRDKLGLFSDYIQTVPYIGYRFKE